MAFFSGSDGQLILAPREAEPDSDGILRDPADSSKNVEQVIAKVKSWSVTSSTATLDVTTLGDTDRTFREGIRSASGNADIFFYTDTPSGGTNLSALLEYQLGDRDEVGVGTTSEDEPEKFTLKFLMGRGTQDPYYLIGRCAITSFTLTMAVGEISSASIAFDINGAFVKYRI